MNNIYSIIEKNIIDMCNCRRSTTARRNVVKTVSPSQKTALKTGSTKSNSSVNNSGRRITRRYVVR